MPTLENSLKVNKTIDLIKQFMANNVVEFYMEPAAVLTHLSSMNPKDEMGNYEFNLTHQDLTRYTNQLNEDNVHLFVQDPLIQSLSRTESIVVKEYFSQQGVTVDFPSFILLTEKYTDMIVVSLPAHAFSKQLASH